MGVTMSLHKLTAGSGYDYLTRQVAAQDATEKGHTGLASYYAAKGEAPGMWLGSGMAGIEGLSVGDTVTAEQMQALFGSGHHPLAQQRVDHLEGPDLTDTDYQAATRLGTPYKVYGNDVSPFRIEVAKRIAAVNETGGLPANSPVPVADRARARTEVAIEFFHAQYGRDPQDAREVAATIAKHSRPRTNAVAGYDLTFSPVKSVSTLWAIADPATAAKIEGAHQAAVKDALKFIEEQALFTRLGTNGVRQVNVQGLVAAAFTHRDSRAGDPDLHTHVAVANKVQTGDGRWLSIDGRILFKANVSASETYNTALEKHLGQDLGLRFAERPGADPSKRPVREVVRVDPRLNERWSARRASIETRRSQLAEQFQRTHCRPPTPIESIQLAQQATLETREAKHDPRSLGEQRKAWREQATEVLGGDLGITAMLRSALSPQTGPGRSVDAAWVSETADAILATVESRRSTWQMWHVRAEALRQVRGTDLPAAQVEQVVALVVDEVLTSRSVSLELTGDGIDEPEQLQRKDGSSVYTIAGSRYYSSARVLDAEQRLVAMAGRTDGRRVDAAGFDITLLEQAANGVTLNAGQAALVRGMATSGARLQLAIAPAGAGKTTAMRALAAAWTGGGGRVIGLAPSAAAATALREQIDTCTDTLAKLTWSIEHDDLPEWAQQIGAGTLVVVDEAGMADTLSLDAAVTFVVARGGSVRLIGDDQQLAAIGAGGVLRDLDTTCGALRLTELMRFADPAEGAASLAFRDGQREALGFYLDNNRVHVGDLATMTEDVFTAWQLDRANGLDAIMLAPTRDLVSQLNQRAREHRLAGADAGRAVRLADGNDASVGELVITRRNERKLRISASDWVKNGDRWSVLAIGDRGDLTVQHTQNGRIVTLPAAYVTASTELGYAATIHTAQGINADAGHTLLIGQESRQLAYTAATRGRYANHLYLQVVGDGDPHNVIRPDNISPLTATDILAGVISRDDSPVSAATMLREQADPSMLLGQAAARYVDALYVAAEDLLGRDVAANLEAQAGRIVPGICEGPAWPTLRAHLLLVGAAGADPVTMLRAAATSRELDTAADPAAVLDWRLDDSGLRNAGRGPLPWVPAVPAALAVHPTWGDYLTQRARLAAGLAERVRETSAGAETPSWARQGTARPSPTLLGEVQVWRAATQVKTEDRRPTGAPQMQKAAAMWQRGLERRLTGDRNPAMLEWGALLHTLAPAARHDDFTPLLAERLAAISRTGLNSRALLAGASAEGILPDDHAGAALWWRISRHLSPTVAAEADRSHSLTTAWAPRLGEVVGSARAEPMQASSWWPALVTTVDRAIRRGWQLEDLLATAGHYQPHDDVDECQAMVWRISVLTDPPPAAGDDAVPCEEELPPEDLWVDVEPRDDGAVPQWHNVDEPADLSDLERDIPGSGLDLHDTDDIAGVEADLSMAALARPFAGPLEPTDADVERMITRAADLDFAPVPHARMLEVNQMISTYYQSQYDDSWARAYLEERFGQDLSAHPYFTPGHAPSGWTGLVSHLRGLGVTDEEMTETGVATVARTGHLIDRFRDRAMIPIVHDGQVLGFVGRRRPDLTDGDNAGPKYLNTADTPLFHKGAQLFGADPALLNAGAVPVLVEGPMDAIAVTLATGGSHVGVAPLGTSLTEDQAAQLASFGRDPIVATDADLAGRIAAERDFWMLAQHNINPAMASFPEGSDPADVLTRRGPAAMESALHATRPLGEVLLDERLTNLSGDPALEAAAQVLAAQPASTWEAGSQRIAERLGTSTTRARQSLRTAVRTWDRDPRRAAQAQIAAIRAVRARMEAERQLPPAQRWEATAHQIDPRLVGQSDWPALAAVMQHAHDAGHDVATLTRALVHEEPLGDLPAQDLRYWLVTRVQPDMSTDPSPASSVSLGAAQDRRSVTSERGRPTVPRR
jgi:DNA primase catalytic core